MRRDLQSSQERIREMVTQGKLAASFTPIVLRENPSCSSGAEQSFSSRPVSFVSLESEECSTPGEDPHSSPTAGERN